MNFKKLIFLTIVALAFGKESSIKMVGKSINNTSFIFTAPELEIKDNMDFKIIESNSGTTTINGMPELPQYTSLIKLSKNKNYRIEFHVKSSHILENVKLYPHQGFENSEKFIINDDFYNSTDIFPLIPAGISTPMAFRGIEVAELTVIPYQYNPALNRLEVFDEIEIQFIEEGERNSLEMREVKKSRVFEKLQQAYIENYETSSRSDDYQTPSILYICGGSSLTSSAMQDLIQWRREQGYKVVAVSTIESGSSSSAVKSYIENAYQNWDTPPEIVGLIGDTPTSTSEVYEIDYFTESWSGYYGDGDQPYALLEGNDLFPEIFIGRISVTTSSQLANVVSKTIAYEKASYLNITGSNWYEKAALVGDPSYSGQSTIITNEYIENTMEVYGFENVLGNYGQGNYANWMENKLEDGILYFNYRGYIGVSNFGSNNINSANNGFKTPFATFLTCGTGGFSGTCLSEQFLLAGSVANPKGAVAAVGTATSGTHTAFNNIIDMGIYDGIFSKDIETAGGALAAGKLALWDTYPSDPNDKVSIFSHWNNLMGDPALHLWTDTPAEFTVTYDSELQFGSNMLNVEVLDENGLPVESAWITLLKGNEEIFTSHWTNTNGKVDFQLDYENSGDISLTVTRRNFIPYQGTVTINSSDSHIILSEEDFQIIDDGSMSTNGNGDNEINPGETVGLYLPIENLGEVVVDGIIGELSTISNKVELIQLTSYYGTVSPNQNRLGELYLIRVNNDVVDNEDLQLRLTLFDNNDNEWEFSVPVNITGGKIKINFFQVNGGNGISPGDDGELMIQITNNGNMILEGINGELFSETQNITLVNNIVEFGTLAPGGTSVNQVPFSILSSNNIVNGSVLNLLLNFNSASGYDKDEVISLQFGQVEETDPLGPDNYGYYIYDSGDAGYAHTAPFEWIEINPSAGGEGINLNMNDSGDGNYSTSTVLVDLPFTFTFYGEDYSEISVNSNGWIAFGVSNMESFRNYPIPGAGGPSPMLAVFWDDLKTTSGGKVFKYVTDEYAVIEWYNMKTKFQGSVETFEVILYNSNTPSGDDEILIQYRVFNNTSSGSYSGYTPQHGGYCTIGTENKFGNDGLQYTFNNEYPDAAMPLGNATALFITTREPAAIMLGDANFDQEVNILDVIMIVNHVLGVESLSPSSEWAVDIDENGIINILDIIAVLNIILFS